MFALEKLGHEEHKTNEQRSVASRDESIEAIVRESEKKTKAAVKNSNQSDSPRIKNIRQNRAEEKQSRREKEAWILAPEPSKQGEVVLLPQKDEPPEFDDNPVVAKNQAWLEMLKKQREEER